MQNQLINAPASVLAPSDVDIPLQLKGMSVDQLGFVRSTTFNLLCSKRIAGRYCASRNIFPVILLLRLHHPD